MRLDILKDISRQEMKEDRIHTSYSYHYNIVTLFTSNIKDNL